MAEADYRAHATRAMADALRRRDAVLAAITVTDAALGERMAALPDFAGTILELAGADIDGQDAALRVGRSQIAELMGYCAAAGARASGLDDGLPALAERWLDALSSTMDVAHVAVVIPSQQEFTDIAAQVINLRIPFEGIWGLTVAVHEYGHFLASHLTTRRADVAGLPLATVPAEAVLRNYDRRRNAERPDGDKRPYYRLGHELFADAVATLITGPAFSYYCLAHRFDLARSDGSSATHPRYSARMQVQLRVLQHLGKTDEWVDSAGRDVGERWQRLVDAAPLAGDASDDGLGEIADFAVSLACEHPTLRKAQYAEHRAAVQLGESELRPNGARPSIEHVVNAAWSLRLRGTGDPGALAAIDTAARLLLS